MQDRYVGDIGDFGKFALLRHLFAGAQWRPGIVWYRVEGEPGGNDPSCGCPKGGDGRFTDYLKEPGKYREFAPEVFDELHRVVCVEKCRAIRCLDLPKLLGRPVIAYDRVVPSPASAVRSAEARKQAESERNRWLDDAVQATNDSNAVFLDPDNGLSPKSVRLYSPRACKYVFDNEVREFAEGRVCVVYHHLGRHGSHEEQIRRCRERLTKATERRQMLCLKFRRISCRAYFIVPPPGRHDELSGRVDEFLHSGWSGCFERVEPQD